MIRRHCDCCDGVITPPYDSQYKRVDFYARGFNGEMAEPVVWKLSALNPTTRVAVDLCTACLRALLTNYMERHLQ